MPKRILCIPCILLLLFCSTTSFSQADTSSKQAYAVSEKSLKSINCKYEKLTSSIDRQSLKLLNRMQKREEKLRIKLALKDSDKAAELFSNTASSYQQLHDKLNSPMDKGIPNPFKEYLPSVDSLATGLSFLQKVPGVPPGKL